jgi:dTDP-L-rhamnose 4-epimerase
MRLLNDQPPIVYEDGQQLRDYVYVGDVARANLLVLERDETNYQVFNVGGGKAITVLEYAYLLAEIFGKDIEPQVPGEFRFGDTRHIISDISKIRALGWEPTVPLEQIAREYVAWLQTQPHVKDYYAEAERVMKEIGTVRVT